MAKFFMAWLKWGAIYAVFGIALILVLAGGMSFLDWSWQPAIRMFARLDWSFVRLMFLLVVAISWMIAGIWRQ